MARTTTKRLKMRSSSKRIWVLFTGLIVAATIFLNFGTSVIDFVQSFVSNFVSPPPPLVSIRTKGENQPNKCIEFGFERLPANFTLGRISFRIIERQGPIPIAGDMAAQVLHMPVNKQLSPSIFADESKEFDFDVSFQSERDNDAAIVDFCPTLTMPGTRGSLTVVPAFLSVAGQHIQDLEILYDGKPVKEGKEGIVILLSRPKNASVSEDEPKVKRSEK